MLLWLGGSGCPGLGLAAPTPIGSAGAHPSKGPRGVQVQGNGALWGKRKRVLYGKCQESNIWGLRNGRKQIFFFHVKFSLRVSLSASCAALIIN